MYYAVHATIQSNIMTWMLDICKKGQNGDFIIVDNLRNFSVLETYIKGQLVAKNGKTLIVPVKNEVINNFNVSLKKEEDFAIKGSEGTIRVIQALDGELITKEVEVKAKIRNGHVVADLEHDILKLALINRYSNAPVALAFINGFGLKDGALASCIAHDSHNIIAVGTNDQDMCKAVNSIIENRGGIAVASENSVEVLPLSVAGIMSPDDGYSVAKKYSLLDQKAKELGSLLTAPFMTLSFMALLVIPSLKLSDKGLFDGNSFCFTSLFK